MSTEEDIRTLWGETITSPQLQPEQTIKCDALPAHTATKTVVKAKSIGPASDTLSQSPDFELHEKIGQGGMAVIYEARQTSVDRTIAVKMIRPEMAGMEEHRQRFLYEAVVTSDLEHPNIVPIHDLGKSEDGNPFYVMKRVLGTPWSMAITGLDPSENLRILTCVANAVAFAHSRGVIHRDLKPENVMLGEYGEVLLIDWGIAVSYKEGGKADRLTETDAVGGTPAYMPPEMARGKAALIGPASDIYLLGAILYEIITSLKPHTGKTVMEVLTNAANNVIQRSDRDDELADIARKAMATDPAARYANVKDFLAALDEYHSHAESMAFSNRGDELLRKAQSSKNYEDFAHARFTYQQALELWPGNRAARQGVLRARLAYALCACDKGDLDLAESLLVSEDMMDTPLGDRIRGLKEERVQMTADKQAGDDGRRADMLEWAEKYFERSRFAAARDLFEDVAAITSDPARLEQARRGAEKSVIAMKSATDRQT
ncbi:MAG: serine/threonine-protein kinase [Candidatus Sumerlaeota bacterium]|nr:serine/threonine-protein kinase [Candidatus Sumerlaeota bacterium]